jgi:hypothetical protein
MTDTKELRKRLRARHLEGPRVLGSSIYEQAEEAIDCVELERDEARADADLWAKKCDLAADEWRKQEARIKELEGELARVEQLHRNAIGQAAAAYRLGVEDLVREAETRRIGMARQAFELGNLGEKA